MITPNQIMSFKKVDKTAKNENQDVHHGQKGQSADRNFGKQVLRPNVAVGGIESKTEYGRVNQNKQHKRDQLGGVLQGLCPASVLAGEVNAHMRVFQKAVVRTQHKDGRKPVPPDVQQAIGALGEQFSNKGIACADDGGGKINHMVSFPISLLIWSISRNRDSRGVIVSPKNKCCERIHLAYGTRKRWSKSEGLKPARACAS